MDIIKINENSPIEYIRECIRQILTDIVSGARGELDFFLHPLGFYYCRLISTNEHQLRLRFWEANYKMKTDLYIHDHYYDLCSWVLNGSIVDYTYQVDATDKKSDYALFKSSYLAGQNLRTITMTSEYKIVKQTQTAVINKGIKYIIPKETFHSNKVIVPDGEIAVTCVYTFNHKEDVSPHVIGQTSNVEYAEFDPQKLDVSKIIEVCALALKSL